MKQYRFILQPYKGRSTRYTCPNCEKTFSFSRYIDIQGKIHFPEKVGRCNREHNCGYHFTPKDYFSTNPISDKLDYLIREKTIRPILRKPSFINEEIMLSTFKKYDNNHLFKYLKKLFGEQLTFTLLKMYKVGTAKYWDGATVFWQVDINRKIRTGKIMLYDSYSGRRIKKPHNHINWIHSILKLNDFVLEQCFFGEHLINDESQIIAIVESEKTALIASQYFKNYTWIATGGLHSCIKHRIEILKNHKVILFPDINAFDRWNRIAEEMKCQGMQIEVFDYLEKYANEKQRKASFDIADFLIQEKLPQTLIEIMSEYNPILKVFIESFNLELA